MQNRGMGQSAEFGKFLKAMRSRLSPEDAGAEATSGARRVPGLRREEVARLAGVSTDYYIRLEQGRNIHPSRSVLDSVSRALRLDTGQHAHMLDLLENCAASPRSPGPAQGVRPALRQLLEAVGDIPALVLGRRTDVLAGNRMAYLLFTDFRDLPAHERNLTRWLVLDPGARKPWPRTRPVPYAWMSAGTPTTRRPTNWSANSPSTASISVNGGQGTAWPRGPPAACGSIIPPSETWN
jgi:transcriptional regulator with XRE-family HTH domain